MLSTNLTVYVTCGRDVTKSDMRVYKQICWLVEFSCSTEFFLIIIQIFSTRTFIFVFFSFFSSCFGHSDQIFNFLMYLFLFFITYEKSLDAKIWNLLLGWSFKQGGLSVSDEFQWKMLIQTTRAGQILRSVAKFFEI